MATASFDAFISYSRSASASLASDLQLSTERYAKPWNRLRSARLFRDDSSMSANSGFETGLRWNLFDDPLSGVIWLDDDRVFAYSDQGGRAVVLSGSELRTEELIWDMQLGKLGSPDDDDESATLYDAAGDQVYRDPMSNPNWSVNDAGHVLAGSGLRLYDVNPIDGSVDVQDYPGGQLNPSGTLSLRLEQSTLADGSQTAETRVIIYDVIDRRVVFDESLAGRIISGVAWSGDDINLWRSESDGQSTLLHLDALSHVTVEVGRVASPRLPKAVAPGITVTEGDGVVQLTQLDNAASFPHVECGRRRSPVDGAGYFG